MPLPAAIASTAAVLRSAIFGTTVIRAATITATSRSAPMYSAAVWPLWPRSLERTSATVGEEPCAGQRAGCDGDELEQRAGRIDGVRDRQREADERAHRAGAGGADQDDLAAGPGAGQRRLPRAGDAAEGGGDEDDQEPGADLRHLGLDGVEHPDETAQQDEQREQRGRDAGGGRPRDRPHSCCSQDVHIAEASQRCGARREAQDPTLDLGRPGLCAATDRVFTLSGRERAPILDHRCPLRRDRRVRRRRRRRRARRPRLRRPRRPRPRRPRR